MELDYYHQKKECFEIGQTQGFVVAGEEQKAKFLKEKNYVHKYVIP